MAALHLDEREAIMSRGISIHIGLNEVDPGFYGAPHPLLGCENDAHAMAALARRAGFEAHPPLLGRQATTGALAELVGEAASRLAAGDTLLVTYSGHGSFRTDRADGGERDEADAMDETWCLYDRPLLDDDLFGLWGRFAEGVRIAVVSDCCHSGTVTRALPELPPRAKASPLRDGTPRFLPRRLDLRHVPALRPALKTLYEPGAKRPEVRASVLLLGAAHDGQPAMDGTPYGEFTGALLDAWKDGAFKGSYEDLQREIMLRTEPVQRPSLFCFGPGVSEFRRCRPFTL
jgi:metacaspase-1